MQNDSTSVPQDAPAVAPVHQEPLCPVISLAAERALRCGRSRRPLEIEPPSHNFTLPEALQLAVKILRAVEQVSTLAAPEDQPELNAGIRRAYSVLTRLERTLNTDTDTRATERREIKKCLPLRATA
jgi:hypothetical protein